MDKLSAVDSPVHLVFHNDEITPMEFVMRLLRDVFGKHAQDAFALTLLIDRQGKAACGPYPPSLAHALFEAAQEQIVRAGHPLRITSEAAGDTGAFNPSDLLQFEYGCEAIDWHFADIRRTSSSPPCGDFQAICAPTSRRQSTDCLLRQSASSARMRNIVMRR